MLYINISCYIIINKNTKLRKQILLKALFSFRNFNSNVKTMRNAFITQQMHNT